METKDLKIAKVSNDPVIDLALDTIERKRQALVFVNTKPSAEKCAEDISKKIKTKSAELDKLSDEILHALAKPTKQCERLAMTIKKGIAFHHAGLVQKQKDLIEDNFKKGTIKIICCTPTLAAGVNLPAFRAIIRDLKRFGHHGLSWIPVLEYHQQAGRAGRPGYDDYGMAITIAGNESERDEIFERYINGEPEEIFSKLAVEPVLRTYLLSLISADFVNTEDEILKFFGKTFWAHQFEDMPKLVSIIRRMLALLEEWEFIKGAVAINESSSAKTRHKEPERITNDFFLASELADGSASKTRITATLLGKKVAELYIDPLTAHEIVLALRNSAEVPDSEGIADFALLQTICRTLEMRPRLSVKTREWEDVQERLAKFTGRLLCEEPSLYDEDYEDFLASVKTALMMQDWIEEKDEEFLMGKYGVRPGELRTKLDLGDWLLYSSEELSRILKLSIARREIMKLRVRLSHGVREELLPLLKLKNIGRIRARKLFGSEIKDLSDVKQAEFSDIAQLIGPKTAKDIKEQVGEIVDPEKLKVKENKRKGQMNLNDYSE